MQLRIASLTHRGSLHPHLGWPDRAKSPQLPYPLRRSGAG